MRAHARRVFAAASAAGLLASLCGAGCLLVTHEDEAVFGTGAVDASVPPQEADDTGAASRGDADPIAAVDSGQMDHAADASSPTDGGSDAAGMDASAPCQGTAGPTGVRVSTNFCIDSTEVTVGDYAAFLPHVGEIAPSPECADGGSFTPMNWMYQTDTKNPVSAATWCDAQAYCAWAGKRLCGKVGGGPILLNNNSDPVTEASNEWAYACSSAGQRAYPYGTGYDPQACNGEDNSTSQGQLVEVGTLHGCEGGFPGIFDMSGNVYEWTDACDDGGSCQALGGANSQSGPSDMSCTSLLPQPRTKQGDFDVGFRCCSD